MTDIFLSYAREDRAIAERLASAIEASGKTVWWDRHIKGGAQFSKDIERELQAATHVLVLWSAASVESRWVRDEATEGADEERLIGATIDGTPAPLGFRQFHTVDLREWCKAGAALPTELAEAFGTEPVTPTTSAPPVTKSKKPLIIAGTAIALALAGGTYVATQGLPGSSETQTQQITLAVLPFTSSDNDLAAKGPGLSSALSNGFASASGMTMIASTSTAAAASRSLSAQEIGTELGATHLIEGEILPKGDDEVQIILSLVDTATGRQLWSDTLEGNRQLSAGMTRQLISKAGLAMRARLGTGAADQLADSDISPEAYEAYLSALEKLSSRYNPQDRIEAYQLLRRVTRLAPDFAPGHSGLAYIIAHSPFPHLGEEDDVVRPQFEQAIERALALDPGNIEARAAEIIGSLPWRAEVAEGIAKGRALIADHPDSALAHEALAIALESSGHHREAHEHFERALSADPLSEQKRENMLNNYVRYGSYSGLRTLVERCLECPASKGYASFAFIATDPTMEDFNRDWPEVARLLKEDSDDDAAIDSIGEYLPSFITGRPAPLPTVLHEQIITATVLAAARTVGDEAAIAYLEIYASRRDNSGGASFLFDGRAELPPTVRAHPAYHANFREDAEKAIIAYRREQGFLQGLPINPEDIPAEERRMAEEAR